MVTDLQSGYPTSSDVSELLHLATFLNARFKFNPFSESEIEHIKEMLVIEYIGITISTPCSHSSGALEPPPAKKKGLESFFKEHDEDQRVVAVSSIPSLEQQCGEKQLL